MSRITDADEAYGHQLVAPAIVTAHQQPGWAERCWHLVNFGDGWVLGAGRAVNPHAGHQTAKAGLNTGRLQYAQRTREEFRQGDSPDTPSVGSIRIEVVEPLRRVRLILDDASCPFSFDLTYVARFPAIEGPRNRIERHGEVVTDYMHFFQSGIYSGVVVADGEERRYEHVMGFRDRGWGLRKHEGAAQRGMHVFCGCELADESIYMLLYENAHGERMLTSGWTMNKDGISDRAVNISHDIKFDDLLAHEGRFAVTFESGRQSRIGFRVDGRLFMESVGYTSVLGRSDPGTNRLDMSDPGVLTAWQGLFDNGATFECDGRVGNGYVETGLGAHARYRPEGAR
ncbi:hypothetical protein [Chelatococcus sp.]|nr:hypothetical protein [Chelatococcus sp.]MBX3547074.1 hypothetical protein [Chelatococcus sp.]